VHEDEDGADELLPAPPRLFGLRSSRSILNSPTASYASLAQGAHGARPRSLSTRLFARPSVVPAPSAASRPLDALVHFLSATVTPKDTLKHLILARTVSAPFLSAQAVSSALGAPRAGGAASRAGRRTSSFTTSSLSSLPLGRHSFFAGSAC
jgi:hypothetical protein